MLIVEDNRINRLYLERILSKWGYFFRTAAHGREALAWLDKEAFDLILMDIRMPEMDGYETTIRLRNARNNPNCGIPIIALTASALLDEREKVLQAGMNYHLTKPFTPDQLARAIGQFAQKQETAQPPEKEFKLPPSFREKEVIELYGGDWEHTKMMFELFKKTIPGELAHL